MTSATPRSPTWRKPKTRRSLYVATRACRSSEATEGLHVANLLDAVFSLWPKAVAEVGKNSGFRSGRRRLVRKLVPMTTQLARVLDRLVAQGAVRTLRRADQDHGGVRAGNDGPEDVHRAQVAPRAREGRRRPHRGGRDGGRWGAASRAAKSRPRTIRQRDATSAETSRRSVAADLAAPRLPGPDRSPHAKHLGDVERTEVPTVKAVGRR